MYWETTRKIALILLGLNNSPINQSRIRAAVQNAADAIENFAPGEFIMTESLVVKIMEELEVADDR